ncbi:MAG: hypothetical protein AMJ46_06250 [Latescibacteria bacterium DG_63]|nr:MAG: hypothetical protein AMJ46_06250 [Latescibacteria bacterium DG_63]
MRTGLICFLCFLSCLSATLAAESPITTCPVQVDVLGLPFNVGSGAAYSPAPKSQEEPAVAFDGGNYLVVWQDDLTGSSEIRGTRLSPEGEVLDPCGIEITAAPGSQTTPVVAFDGTNYLVVWQDTRNGNPDIYGARVSIDGLVLDTDGIPISISDQSQTEPAMAFGGENYLVVWTDSRLDPSGYGNEIFFARVSPEGAVLDPDGVLVNVERCSKRSPAVAYGGENYLVVWNDCRQAGINPADWAYFYGCRISPDGAVLDSKESILIQWRKPEESLHSVGRAGPAVAFDGENYLAVWATTCCTPDIWHRDDLFCTLVTPEGLVLSPYGVTITTTQPEQLSILSVGSYGDGFLVAWGEGQAGGTNVRARRVTSDGVPLDPNKIDVCSAVGYQGAPVIAFDGVNSLTAWTDKRGGGSDVYGTRITGEGVLLDSTGVVISTAPADQNAAAIAFDGSGYFMVWQETRGEDSDIYGARVSNEGVLLDTMSVAISVAPRQQTSPVVAFDGRGYLVVWEDTRGGDCDIYAARVSVGGVVPDPAGIAVCVAPGDQTAPAVASAGDGCLVVWQDLRGQNCDIFGARVSSEGAVTDPDGLEFSTAAGDQKLPAVACAGAGYLVVWEDARGQDYDIYGARVRPDGVLPDLSGLRISTADRDQRSPVVVCGPEGYFVAWEDTRRLNSDIYGTRVTLGGEVLDSSGIAVLANPHYNSTNHVLAFDADRNVYAIVWEEMRSGFFHLYRTEISATGPALGPSGILVSKSAFGEHHPALAKGNGGRLIAYASFSPAPPCRSSSIWGNLWRVLPTLFSSVSAAVEDGCVVLSWQMQVRVTEESFLIQRSESVGGDFYTLDAAISGWPGLWFSCIDDSVVPARTYWYRIMVSTPFGNETYGPIEVRVAPVAYKLSQGFPNPFNPFCTIRYDIPQAGRVSLRVFDVRGALVRTLVDAYREPGIYSELWNGRAEDGRELPSGVYFYRLEAGEFVATRKMVLLR